MNAPKSAKALENKWGPFIKNVFSRLEMGALTYGDTSFERPPGQLLEEIEQELLDQAGWSFIMWCRLEEVRERLKQLK